MTNAKLQNKIKGRRILKLWNQFESATITRDKTNAKGSRGMPELMCSSGRFLHILGSCQIALINNNRVFLWVDGGDWNTSFNNNKSQLSLAVCVNNAFKSYLEPGNTEWKNLHHAQRTLKTLQAVKAKSVIVVHLIVTARSSMLLLIDIVFIHQLSFSNRY